jgi:hypothetical protein
MKSPRLKKRYILLLVLILLISVVLFALPRAGRWYIVKHSRELTGRSVTIDKIRFNYFTATLRIDNFKMFEEDSTTIFTSFNRLKINLDYFPLLRNEIFVKYILLDDPYSQIIQNGDVFNFSDLLKSDTTKVKADSIPSKPLKYIINNIRISRGFVKYTDQVLDHTISMNRIDLDIPGFTWNSDSTKLGLNFRFVDGGKLRSDLDINQADSTYTVNLKLDSLNLGIIQPYLAGSMYISAIHGFLSDNIRIRGDMRSVMRVSVSGLNHIYGFELFDTLNRKIFAFDDLSVDIDTLLPEKNRISLKSVELINPYILFELIDSTNNWLKIMKPETATASDTLHKAEQQVTPAPQSSFRFSGMHITGGTLQVLDRSIRYPFDYTVNNISMSGLPDKKIPGWVDFSMKATMNKTGSVSADLGLNPDNTNDVDISMNVSQFLMKDAEPYFRHYFGFPVTGGRLNFSTKNKLRVNSLESENSIYSRKFTLGKKTGEKAEYNLPLRLALGVMSDKDGIIDVNVPVDIKGENIKIRNLRKIIFHTIGTLFVKAAVSPVNMIGELLKVDPGSLQEIALQLTDASPDNTHLKSVDILADILNKKPALNLDIIYCLNREKCRDTLACLMVTEEYRKMTGTSGYIPDSLLIKHISSRVPADTSIAKMKISELSRSYLGNGKLDARLDSLSSTQITFLQNYLVNDKGVAGSRFRIINQMPDSIRFEGSLPAFRIYFTAGEENPPENDQK